MSHEGFSRNSLKKFQKLSRAFRTSWEFSEALKSSRVLSGFLVSFQELSAALGFLLSSQFSQAPRSSRSSQEFSGAFRRCQELSGIINNSQDLSRVLTNSCELSEALMNTEEPSGFPENVRSFEKLPGTPRSSRCIRVIVCNTLHYIVISLVIYNFASGLDLLT